MPAISLAETHSDLLVCAPSASAVPEKPMAHCTKCGAVVADDAAFCGHCGAPQAMSASPASSPAPVVVPVKSQMSENLAATLSYVLGWLTGLIFYLIDKRPYVRFHAAQSIVVFGGLNIINFLISALWLVNFMTGFAVRGVIGVIGLVLWILLMIKAYQGERYRVPLAADLSEKIFGKY
jgi:uncharacterized membrane protein